ncbi:unnamed protein product [Rhizophagus irregularis]|nr:unnamed protein product [Rhizophagus irregularis]
MPSLDNAVRNYLAKKNPTEYQRQVENYFVLTAVHRLDKLTKGLVIYPKNPLAKKILYKLIGDKSKITKKYLAHCEKSPKNSLPNYISGYLSKNSQEQKMEFSWQPTKPQAKFCALEVKKIKKESNYQILEVTLHTGRKHQIRSILSYFNCPIIGDQKYGSKIIIQNKIYLLAYKIIFVDLQVRKTSIVPCYGISQDPEGNYLMVMEYIEGGNLRELLKKDYYYKLEFKHKILRLIDTSKGLKDIHQKGLVHCDSQG